MTGPHGGRPGRVRRPRAAVWPAAVVGLVLLGGCFPSGSQQPEGAGAPTTLPTTSAPVATDGEAATDPAFAAYYQQEIQWEGCGDNRECTTVTVPVDWAQPSGPTIELATVRYLAGGDRLGSLLINPGGPGASGYDVVDRLAGRLTTEQVRERYDLVGFDPRGVGRSSGIDCLDDRELDAQRSFEPQADLDTETAAAVAELETEAEAFAQGCAADLGPLLAHIDTESAARDLDVLRDAVGDERLTFLGYSYGTLLGATYADEFPQRVGRLVLDGALDPASSETDVAKGQAAGLEQALRAYVTDCLDGDDCPLRGSPEEALQQVVALIESTDDAPLPTGGPRPLTRPLAFTGLIAPLYDDATWKDLDAALKSALDGDGSGLLALADAYSFRRPDGTYSSNILEAFTAINCLDYPVDASLPALEEAADEIRSVAPLLGRFMTYGDVTCGQWPVPAVRTPAPLTAAGAAPILVIGTTGDPATPYEWAVSLADQLESGRLLTYDGEGHTAFGRGSDCIDAAVEAYLVDGVLVGDGGVCR